MFDYYQKYTKYKSKYLILKKYKKGGKLFDYCNLPRNADLHFGSGGSDAIIAVLDDIVYKYFPIFVGFYDPKIKEIINLIKYEIMVIKKLTEKFVYTNKTPHIVKYYNYYKCDKIPSNIFNICDSYVKYLTEKKQFNNQCDLLYKKGYPRKLISPMFILEMEKVSNSLENSIIEISKKKWKEIEIFLDRLFFQIFFTLEIIKTIYPNYIHNDLFIRNILTENNKGLNNKFIRYKYKNNFFDLPANGLFIKINDFSMNQLSKSFYIKNNKNNLIINDHYRDYFSIIYDVYNGANLGSKSLKTLIKNKNKLEKIDKYFNKFINVKIINKIIKNNKKNHLDWDWGKTEDPNVIKLFGLKPIKYYILYFINIFQYNKNNEIVYEFGI